MKQQLINIIRHPFLKVGMLTTLAGLIILIFYLSLANIMAIRKEKKIEQDLEAFASQFPPADFNDTANQIRQLTPKLGFGLWGLSSESENSIFR
jgi:membrane-anchored glycerophosphoryl diester phosphodiesterase (GDPDase)